MRARVSVVGRGGGVAWTVVCVCASSWKGCVPMPDHQNQSARVVRTRVSVGPSSCCVPNMHAKDERPDVLVDAGAAGLGACVVLRRRLG